MSEYHGLPNVAITPARQVELTAEMWGAEPTDKLPSPGNIHCERCGTMHGLHADCRPRRDFYRFGPGASQLDREPQFKFNNLHLSHLPVKIDGHTEHLFVAILNGEAVGQVIALKQPWGPCGLRMLFVTPKHRHKGIGSRLVSRVQVFAHNEGCDSIQICVHKGNAEARKFWIRRRFIDMGDEDDKPEYTCMTREMPTP